MEELQRFYETDDEFGRLHRRLKQIACPHCRRVGTMNLHDVLRGYDERLGEGKVVRGRRVYCSKRNRRRGCGKTVCILRAVHLSGFMITAVTLWRFFAGVAAGVPKRVAFRRLGTSFHESGGWRLYRHLSQAQSRIRSFLLRHIAAPEPPRTRDPVLATLVHLRCSFPNTFCPITAFQYHFQTSFL